MDDDGDLQVVAARCLRYALTLALLDHGPLTIAELLAALRRQGIGVGGRSSKAVSDALRWEVAHGRVRRLGWGRYGPGTMSKQTRSFLRQQLRSMLAGEYPYAR